MKTEQELRHKLKQMLGLDASGNMSLTFSKVAAVKTLLWALGENDDDRWYIRAAPGDPVDSRAKDRN